MATYKKRGYKKSIEAEEVIVDNEGTVENSTTAEVFNTLDETANKSEKWIEKNSKPLFISLIVVVVAIFGYMGYTEFVKVPTEKKAANALVFAKEAFNNASTGTDVTLYNKALEGAEGHYGLVDIADNYSGTQAGNLAKYYAGISYYNLKEYDKAISYLKDVHTDDTTLNAVILGVTGDAYLASNNEDEALDYFSKAATSTDNEAIAPVYYLKAGKLALKLEDFSKAEELFNAIKTNFSKSTEANNVDLYINKAKYAN